MSGKANFGWDVYEGNIQRKPIPDGLPGVLVRPFVVYRHQPRRCNSVIGGYVYRGTRVPSLRGRYVYGDLCGGIWSVSQRRGNATDRRREPFNPPGIISSFGEGNDGELFVLSFDGHVYRLIPDLIDGDTRRCPRARAAGWEAAATAESRGNRGTRPTEPTLTVRLEEAVG